MTSLGRSATAATVAFLVLALALAGARIARADAAPVAPPPPDAPDAALEQTYAEARDAAVRVESSRNGVGSGFVVDPDGLVLTAYHVVRDSRVVRVGLADGSRHRAEIVGFDEYTDRALLAIDRDGLAALTLAPEAVIANGTGVVAIGNSRGAWLAPRYGVVTGVGRTISAAWPPDLIATTVPLAPGDSGGPVLAADGTVVGIAFAVQRTVAGFTSFATPLAGAPGREAVAALAAGLRRSLPYLGITTVVLTPEAAAAIGFGAAGNLVITGVAPGSPGDIAGLRGPRGIRPSPAGGPALFGATGVDVVVSIDGRPVDGDDVLVAHLRTLEVGDRVEVTVLREGVTLVVSVELGARPQ